MACSSVLVSSIKPIVWLARCIGQLPVIWNEQQHRWHVAPWYHPQFLYFVCLLLFRIFIYGYMSYVLLTTMFMTSSLPTSITHVAETGYTWLRLVFAPYALLFSVRPLNEALEKIREVDSVLGIQDKITYCHKPRMFTFLAILATALITPMLAIFSQNIISWYDSTVTNLPIGSLVAIWCCLDLIMETAVLAQFCVGCIILQQRLGTLCFQLKQFSLPGPFLSNSEKGSGPKGLNCRNQCSLQFLQNSYNVLCQVSKGICEGFGWPMLFLSLGNTTVFTISICAVLKPTLIDPELGANDEFYTLYYIAVICQAVFNLAAVSYFANIATNEVSKLQMDLQTLASCTRVTNFSELKQDLRHFYLTVCLNPPEKPTAAQFYNLGRSLLPGVLGVVVTYAIVLMQYGISQKCESNSLNQTSVSHRTV